MNYTMGIFLLYLVSLTIYSHILTITDQWNMKINLGCFWECAEFGEIFVMSLKRFSILRIHIKHVYIIGMKKIWTREI